MAVKSPSLKRSNQQSSKTDTISTHRKADHPVTVNQDRILIDPIEMARRKITNFLKVNSPFSISKDRFNHELSKLLGNLSLTDTGNSVRFWARYGHLIHWVAEQKCFYIYEASEGRWREAKRGEIMSWAKNTAALIVNEARLLPLPTDANGELIICPQINLPDKPTPEQQEIIKKFRERDEREDALKKWAKQSLSRRSIEAMIELVKSESGIPIVQSDLDSEETDWLFNCLNGVLDLRTFELKSHNPLLLITKLAPINHDPLAKRPESDKFWSKVMGGNKELIQFNQDLAGCGLVGKQLDDILVINQGPGGNGKGIFAETMKGMMGDYAAMANSDLFLAKDSEGISNDRACLSGVRFLIASETDEGKKLNEALVKSMTGGDTQRVRFLHKEFFDLTPKFTPMLFTNHKPIISGTDKGIWRRVKIVPWMHDFEKDPEIETRSVVMERLKAEYSGILNWCLEGLKHRMQTNQIQVPSEIKSKTDKYRKDSDTFGDFLEDCCIVSNAEAEVAKKDLYDKYTEFAKEAGQSNTTTAKGFGMKLRERTDVPHLGERKGTGGVRFWTGIRLRTEFDPPPPSDNIPDEEANNLPNETPLPQQQPLDTSSQDTQETSNSHIEVLAPINPDCPKEYQRLFARYEASMPISSTQEVPWNAPNSGYPNGYLKPQEHISRTLSLLKSGDNTKVYAATDAMKSRVDIGSKR